MTSVEDKCRRIKEKNGKYYYAVVCHFSGKHSDFGAPFDHCHAIINGGMEYRQKCHISLLRLRLHKFDI